jgi:hypothetical protein
MFGGVITHSKRGKIWIWFLSPRISLTWVVRALGCASRHGRVERERRVA